MTGSQPVQLFEIYRFLAQAMRYPDKSWFDGVFMALYITVLRELEWVEAAQFVPDVSPQDLEELQVEHTRLFITGVPAVIAPPYASIYMDDIMLGPTAERTRQFYLEHGFALNDNDFPDSLVAELEFVAVLEQNEEGGAEPFLAELFRPWFALFKAQLLQGTTHPYYLTTVKLIDFFTRSDEE